MVFQQTWITLFYDPLGKPDWHARFRRKGFRHCVMMSPRYGHWIYVDVTSSGVTIDLLNDRKARELFFVFKRLRATALQLSGSERPYPVMGIHTCATFASRVYGLAPRLTPYGLYRALRKNGAKPFSLEKIGEL